MTFLPEFKTNNDNNRKDYKIKSIYAKAVYVKESEGHLPGLYYLIS